MVRRRKSPPTRLTLAWIGLASIMGAAVGVVLLAPVPKAPENRLVIELPSEPDRYAATVRETAASGAEDDTVIPLQEGPPSPQGLINTPMPEAPLPVDTISDALEAEGGGAVVITIPEDASLIANTRAPQTPDEEEGESGASLPTPSLTTISETKLAPPPADKALMAKGEGGTKPKISADGRTPFQVYRRQVPRDLKGQPIALMVSGLGIDLPLTEKAILALPPEVSLSFTPYTNDLIELMEQARKEGHEVVIEIPMEETNMVPEALGSAALLSTHSVEGNARRLDWILSRAPAYPLVTNYLGRRFMQDAQAAGTVLASVDAAGLGFIDDTGLMAAMADRLGAAYGKTSLVIPPGAEDPLQQLTLISQQSRQGAPMLVKIYADPSNLSALIEWITAQEGGKLTLVPASAVVKDMP
ncbi:MAG: divergent polysaccharide deacetylase family protein [Pseudomonadota bacterium]